MDKKLISLAQKGINSLQKEREEVIWLNEKYDRFRKNLNIESKADADLLLYERMYAESPKSRAALSKIRFWRTGRHIPMNRQQVLLFGKALELSAEEIDYLLQKYWDRSDIIFDEQSVERAVYQKRKKLLDECMQEYFQKVSPSRKLEIRVANKDLENNFRHLYFTDALKYVHSQNGTRYVLDSHMTSVNYGSELSRNMNLIGEIPRKTMIRHLILLGMPFLNVELMNERLLTLGYCPLDEKHTLTSGEYLDALLIELFTLYEKECRGKDCLECMEWFQKTCQALDFYFIKHGQENLRFMYFKALNW